MSDIVLNPLRAGFNLNRINSNFDILEEVVNNGILHLEGGNNIMKQNLDMNSNRILNVKTGDSPGDIATKGYVDTQDALKFDYVDTQGALKFDKVGGTVSGDVSIQGTLDVNNNVIRGVDAPTTGTDATNKEYVDVQDALKFDKVGGTVNGDVVIQGTLDVSNNKIGNLQAGGNNLDAVNVQQLHTLVNDTIEAINSRMDAADALKFDKSGGTVSGGVSIQGTLDVGNNVLQGVGTPAIWTDAANKEYVDAADNTRISKAGDTMIGTLHVIDDTATTSAVTRGTIIQLIDNAVESISELIDDRDQTVTATGTTTSKSLSDWFGDLGTAAQADTGTAPGEVPTNADLGTAAQADTGTASGEVPTNADLGTAAYLNTGTAAGEVPTNATLSASIAGTAEAVKTAYDKGVEALDVANSKANENHSHGAGDLPNASTSAKGVSQLNSATNSTSEVLAATPKAVKAAYDKGVEALGVANSKANASHTHSIANVSGLQEALDSSYDLANSKAAASHTHSVASGTVDGFMSKADKTKLDTIATGATNITVSTATNSTSTTNAASSSAVKAAYDLAALNAAGGAGADLSKTTVIWSGLTTSPLNIRITEKGLYLVKVQIAGLDGAINYTPIYILGDNTTSATSSYGKGYVMYSHNPYSWGMYAGWGDSYTAAKISEIRKVG